MRSRLALLLAAAALVAALAFLVARWPSPVSSLEPEASIEAVALFGDPAPAEPEPAAAPTLVAWPESVAASQAKPAPVSSSDAAPKTAAKAAPAPEAVPAPSVSLEKLLTVTTKPALAGDLDLDRNPHLREGVGPGDASGATADDGLRVKSRAEQVGPGGQTAVKRTDASMGVPIGESVDLRGGVAVERRRAQGESADTEAQPKVGVEVRF